MKPAPPILFLLFPELADRVDPAKMGAPSFLLVLPGGEYAYRRPDGVWVVPLACLGA